MKTFKKITAFCLTFILLITLAGCGATNQAESAVRKMFSAFRTLDFDTAQNYIDVDQLAGEEEDAEQNKMFMNALFDKLEYKIISSEKLDKNKVIVKAEVTNLDMKPVMGEYFKASLEYAFSVLFADPKPSDEEQAKKMEEIFAECIAKPDLGNTTTEVDITVNKTENGWRIEPDTKLANAMLGGLLDAAVSLGDALGEAVNTAE